MLEICNSNSVEEGHSKSITVKHQAYFIVRRYGQVFAYRNQCPHLGVELNWQADKFLSDDSELIQCANHAALFVIESGKCVAGPCVNQYLEPLKLIESNGKIYAL